jgi:ribosomal protein L44E
LHERQQQRDHLQGLAQARLVEQQAAPHTRHARQQLACHACGEELHTLPLVRA